MPKKHLPAAQQLVVAGVLTRDDLRAAELNPQLGDRVARTGDALRLAPSTYVLSTIATDAQLVAAAREHAGDDCVVTGLLACRLLELPDVPDSARVDVLVPDGRRRVSTGYVRVSPTIRPPRSWLHASGARIADPHRAVADAVRGLRSLQDARALVLGALRDRRLGSGYGLVLSAAVDARRQAAQPEPPGLVVRPFDPRSHVVRDICHPAPMIDRSNGPVRWVYAA